MTIKDDSKIQITDDTYADDAALDAMVGDILSGSGVPSGNSGQYDHGEPSENEKSIEEASADLVPLTEEDFSDETPVQQQKKQDETPAKEEEVEVPAKEEVIVEEKKKEVPVEEAKKEDENTVNGKDITKMTDEEILAELEAELKGIQAKTDEAQAKAEEIKSEIDTDTRVNDEEHNKLVEAYNEQAEALDIANNEIENTRKLLDQYKKKAVQLVNDMGEKELDNITNAPILKAVNADDNIKGFLLALSKSDEKPALKDKALDYIYNWVEKSTGVNMKDAIEKEKASQRDALSTGETNAGFDISSKGKPNTPEDEVINAIFSGQ